MSEKLKGASLFRSGKLFALGALLFVFAMSTLHAQQQDRTLPSEQGTSQSRGSSDLPRGSSLGNSGGAAQADFDSLIDLIQSTVDADSWADNGTGEGQIFPFDVNGVYADPQGTLRFSPQDVSQAAIRKALPAEKQEKNKNTRSSSPLRYVSLRRLEAAIAARQRQHLPLTEEILTLAGLQRIQYLMLYPETEDLVLAGPAGDWQVEPDGRIVAVETGLPIVRLDDLLTLWRRRQVHKTSAFGCSISPRQAGLAKTQAYLRETNSQPIDSRHRPAWLTGLRKSLGQQEVEFFGMAANSHVARVLLVADYHMKLIGMGLADSVDGVSSYLDTVQLDKNGSPPPMAILRWWFAMNYEPVETDAERTLFCLRGQGVKVLSENELLAERGRRVPTGQSNELNRRFASSFTSEFEAICLRYPLYGELRNVFDLSMVIAIIEREGLAERIGWLPRGFVDSRHLRLPTEKVPRVVETVLNHRVIKGRHIVAGISGGVWLDTEKSLAVRKAKGTAMLRVKKQLPEATEGNDGNLWWWD